MNEQNRKHSPEDVARRMELQKGVFLKDAEIYHLQAEKLEMLQQLVVLEMEMYGRISQRTASIMEVENCEIMNGVVRFMAPWEIREEQEQRKAGSVHEKLGQYKVDVKMQQPDRGGSMERQNRETPELV